MSNDNDYSKITEAYRLVYEMSHGIAEPHKNEVQNYITRDEMVQKMVEHGQVHKGTSFISLTQITLERTRVVPGGHKFVLPGLKKGDTFFAKVSQVGCEIGFDYAKQENREREKVGLSTDFVPQSSIYNKVDGSKTVEELDGQLYLYYKPRSLSRKFSPVTVKAIVDNPINPEDFAIVTPEEVAQYKTPSVTNRLTEVRKVSINSIAAIKIAGQNYKISDLDPIRNSIYIVSGAPIPPPAIENNTLDSENEI